MIAALALALAPGIAEVAWSKNGTLATLTTDGQLEIWSEKGFSTQKFARNIKGTALAISEDGSVVAMGAENNTLVWWTKAGRWQGPYSKVLNGEIGGIAISPDKKMLAGGCLGTGFIYALSSETGDYKRVFQEKGNGIGSLEFSPDGKTLAAGGQSWRLWDPIARAATRGGTPDSLLWNQGGWTVQVSFSPKGDLIAGVGVGVTADQGHPKTLSLRRASDGSVVRTFRHKDLIFNTVDYAPDGKTITIGTKSGDVLVVDGVSLKLQSSWRASTSPITSLAYAPNANRLLIGDEAGNAKMWTLKGEQLISYLRK